MQSQGFPRRSPLARRFAPPSPRSRGARAGRRHYPDAHPIAETDPALSRITSMVPATPSLLRRVKSLVVSTALICALSSCGGSTSPQQAPAVVPAPAQAAPAPPALVRPALPPAPPDTSTLPDRKWDLEWVRSAVFYEVFVRSFRDTDGDGKGDFRGLTEKLDYLNDGNPATTADLGIDGLWLMPVFASPSYHGYDVTDYEKVNPDYGTEEDFARLISESHRRGIKVIVDLTLNHSSAQHPWFRDSAASATSPFRDWYIWRADNPGWTQPWGGSNPTWHARGGSYYYGIFWGGMPDLNFRNAAVRAEARRIASYWLEKGLDGFRLDAARHMIEDGPGQGQCDTPETHAFWKEFAAHVRRVKPSALLVGENWTDTDRIAEYYGDTSKDPLGDELPMSFNFPLASALVSAVQSGDGSGLAAKLEEISRSYPRGVLDGTFLTNHDMKRVASQLGEDPGKLRLAAGLLLTLPGTPWIYYGEEVGLANGSGDQDESKRSPMPWNDSEEGGGFTTGKPWYRFSKGRPAANVAAQTADEGSLFALYRRLIRLRKEVPALGKGSLAIVPAGSGSTFAFVREAAGERILVAHNLGADSSESGVLAIGAERLEPLFVPEGVSAAGDRTAAWRVTVPARGTGVWRLR